MDGLAIKISDTAWGFTVFARMNPMIQLRIKYRVGKIDMKTAIEQEQHQAASERIIQIQDKHSCFQFPIVGRCYTRRWHLKQEHIYMTRRRRHEVV